ncbi:hypothetical protein, partial [Campylobacter concisus]|uniref:hypothetical protein n=1 Tax=Campylobacter concisus TaxID=199 RepID=UPI001CA569B3
AQLGERLNGIQEVGGSIPLNSTMILFSFLLTNIFTFFMKFYVKYIKIQNSFATLTKCKI